MDKKRVLFISQEICPYLPDTEMSMVGRFFPQKVQESGYEIRTFMPRYGCINERRNQLHEVIRLSGINMIIDDTDHPLIIKVASIQSARMQVYFIDNDDYFSRKDMVVDSAGKLFPDTDERIIFFDRGVFETVVKLRWIPDLVFCQGWFTALVPLYLKKVYRENPIFSKAKVIFNVLDKPDYPGSINASLLEKSLVEGMTAADLDLIKEDRSFSALNRLAISYSDAVTFQSESAEATYRPVAEALHIPAVPFLPTPEEREAALLSLFNDLNQES